MKLDIPDDYLPRIIEALEHRYAYTRAVQREDPKYQEIADWFKRKRPERQTETPTTKRRKA